MDKETRRHLVSWVAKYYDPDDVAWAAGVMQDFLEERDPEDAEQLVGKGWGYLEDYLTREGKLGLEASQKRPRAAHERGKKDDPAQLRMFNPKRKGETLGRTIKRLRREGYPQRQAVAIAHREHGVARPRAARRRKNPSLVTYLANPSRGAQIASDVQAILYRHAKDGAYYLHVFGNQGDGDVMRSRGREYLRIDNLPARTGVQLVGHGDVLTVRHRDGRALEREF